MKQIYLRPRSGVRSPLRSDTLFGLIVWGVRQVYGPGSVERFLAPLQKDVPQAPLVITSAFPYVERDGERVHFFPRPLSHRQPGLSDWIEDRELLAFVTGHGLKSGVDGTIGDPQRLGLDPTASSGLFFLASGPCEHYLEAALGFLESFGFGGRGSVGHGAFEIELKEAQFLRLAQPGELSLLLSLYAPSADERAAIAAAAAIADSPVWYGVERRRGVVGGRLMAHPRPFKRAMAMLTEGSILPRAGGESCGEATEVGRAEDSQGGFPLLQHGFGFLVPLADSAP